MGNIGNIQYAQQIEKGRRRMEKKNERENRIDYFINKKKT